MPETDRVEPGVVDGLVEKLDALRYHTLVPVDDDEVERVACEAADALLALKAEVDELRGALDLPTNWELSHFGLEGEDEWRVHSVNGGRNDREWTLIGTGNTPLEALSDARAILSRESVKSKEPEG